MLPPKEDCKVYIKAKLTSKVYKKSTSQEVYNYLDKISSDIYSPFSKKTYNNYKYFITFLDKKTRFLEVALLKTKDEVFKAFYNFKARSENNSQNKRIRIFQTDNGPEYVNIRLREYLLKEGIIHQLNAPYIKEAYGFAERRNRTLLNEIRALLINAEVPLYL
jgi:transposase InsO family protein